MSDTQIMDSIDGYNMPFSLDAEQSLLGAVLIDPVCYERVIDYVSPESFYLPQHRAIFACIANLYSLGKPVDFVTVLEELKNDGSYDEANGKAYLLQIAQQVPSIANVEAYAKIVREKYYIRALISSSRETIDQASGGAADSEVLLDSAEDRIYKIRQGREIMGLRPVRDVVIDTFDRLYKLASDDAEDLLGVPTGLSGVDKIILGLNKSDLILLAARPGVGKTSFALNVASNVASRSKKTVAVFSLEMSSEQLVERLISSEACVPTPKMRIGDLNDDEWRSVAEAGGVISNYSLYIDDTSAITVPQMKAKLRRIKNVGLVVIDYLQLMNSARRIDNRVQEIAEITRSLKIMAKELDVPILCLSQLSRSAEKNKDHRPMLSDLRDSGAIEQDADIVMFLYREALYAEDMEAKAELANVAECIIAKNRHGNTGSVPLYWEGQYTRFTTQEVRGDDS